jgi:hypothetical protein
MADRGAWAGTAADLLRLGTDRFRDRFSNGDGWPKNPRALAGRLRRAQTALRSLGIEIGFRREGRIGTRVINISKGRVGTASTVGSVSTVSNPRCTGSQPR